MKKCSYCIKPIGDKDVRFHRDGRVFCSESCSDLYNLAETFIVPIKVIPGDSQKGGEV